MFAASASSTTVAGCTTTNITPVPTDPSASSDSSVRPSTGPASNTSIRAARPINSVPSTRPSPASARRARAARGVRNEGVALAMASTPVSAAQPLANAASSNRMPTVCGVTTTSGAGSGASGSPRHSPTTISTTSAATNTSAGSANSFPPATTPRRLTVVTITSTTRHSGTVHGSSTGNAEVSAATPAATDTATLST